MTGTLNEACDVEGRELDVRSLTIGYLDSGRQAALMICGSGRDRVLSPTMSSLTEILTELVREAFQAEGLPTEHAGVAPSNRPDLGQFQSNGALAVAKALKRNPREIAERIRAKLLATHAAELGDVSLAGPGFVNISLTDAFLAAHLNRLTEDERLGV